MTTQSNKQRERLKTLLKELFQLDKPELDFGLYKIMHAKSAQITQFLDHDLLEEIKDAFGAEGAGRVQQAEHKVSEAIDHAKNFGAPDPEATPGVAQARAAYQVALESGNTEAEIYDHLYRFFERYYDNGDFLSKRYYARENDTRAAPYSVPYDGREVYLHWANKDQYYIKSGEYLNNFSFDLTEAVRLLRENQTQPIDSLGMGALTTPDGQPLKVHMHLAQAQEGEHGNIKAAADQKREFIPLLSRPIEFNAQGELVLNFEYKTLPPEGYPIDAEASAALMRQYDFKNKGDVPAHWMVDVFLRALSDLTQSDTPYLPLLAEAAPTDTQKKRPLLAKYIQKYTARNTMDYFIHKDLGGFLKRELDFYIKNELMRLDDIESADAPRVEQYLGKIKALRRIAHQLIKFLAQLEDFQKKLWLKKKFVTETQYCITLDRVPESLYPAIAASEAQREEWVKLFAIDEIVGDTAQVGYSVPLTMAFLKENPFLLIDTALYDEGFKATLLSSIEGLDAQCDGVLFNSENLQTLNVIGAKYANKFNCVGIDPPYNTGSDGFCYRDGYGSSSWLAQQNQTLTVARDLLDESGSLFAFCDENEFRKYGILCESIFGLQNFVETIIWNKRIPKNDKGIGNIHDYIFLLAKNLKYRRDGNLEFKMRKDDIDDIYSVIKKERNNKSNLDDAQKVLKDFYKKQGYDRGLTLYCELDPNYEIWGKINMSWPNAKTEGPRYEVINPVTNSPSPIPNNGWRWKEETFRLAEMNGPKFTLPDGSMMMGQIWYPNKKTVQPSTITYLKDVEYFLLRSILSIKSDGGVTLDGLDLGRKFDYPKSVLLIEKLLYSCMGSNGLILDYFGGSGTTAHSVINLNNDDAGTRKYVLVEMGGYFDTILIPRIKKVVYSTEWANSRPSKRRSGCSHAFKYLRLESYEDTLNNLSLQTDPARDLAVANNPALRQDYVLNYWLDVETQGSPSLLNVAAFRDPTAYQMRIKQPGTDVLRLQPIDLIETFNWLIGLWVDHMAAPQTFDADFKREVDPVLPKDQSTRLVCKRVTQGKPDAPGTYWFRLVEGYTLRVSGDDSSRQKTLVVWRKLTDDAEKDSAALQHFLMGKLAISPRESTYAVIYVNGSHTLPNPVVEGEQTKVRLIEEAFHAAMWSQDGA